MNVIIILMMCILGLSLIGCDNGNQYDKGYEAAWDNEEEPSRLWASKQEKEGYKQGLEDSYMYDEGYYDGANQRKAKYVDDPFYMDGFKDSRKNK